MQQVWFWDVTVVTIRCVVLIPESQNLWGKGSVEIFFVIGLVIGCLSYLFAI